MSFASSLAAQIAAVVDSLSKAAVAEISQLVEEGSLVLRLEMRRKDAEIQELRRSLKRMEVDLCSAQEAAAARAAEDSLRGADEKEAQKTCAVYLEPAHCLLLPGPGTEERRAARPLVKREPADDPAPQDAADATASMDICFEAGDPDDPIWPPPACGMFEKSAAAFPPHQAEGYAGGSGSASPAAEEVADDPLSVPIKVEVEFRPMCMVSEAYDPAREEGPGHAAHPADRYLPFASPQAGPSAAPRPPAPRSSSGLGADDRAVNGNNPRAKRPANVWRSNLKVFPRVSQLEEHRASHQLFKPFRCLKCGKSFTQKTRLKTHQSVHTGERPFSCKICGKMFSRQDNCLRHERFHSGLKPHSCGRCGKSFTVLGNLKIHQEIHRQGR